MSNASVLSTQNSNGGGYFSASRGASNKITDTLASKTNKFNLNGTSPPALTSSPPLISEIETSRLLIY